MNSKQTLTAIVCTLCIATMPLVFGHHTESQRMDQGNAFWPIEPFTLVDHRGEAFTQERLQGHWTLFLFGDTHCAEACSGPLMALNGMYDRIARTEAVKTTQVVFVSLDPQRDTPARLEEYLSRYNARFVGATGVPQMTERLARAIGATLPDDVQPVSAANHGGGRYDGTLYLIGPDGATRAEFLPPFDALRLTAAFLKIRARNLGAREP